MECYRRSKGSDVCIIITGWALQSYLELLHSNVFTAQEYWTVLRPDIELLTKDPSHPKFQNSKFWGVATDKGGQVIPGGHKMKWHNFGAGCVQLRLAIFRGRSDLFLCRGYVKDSVLTDHREMAKFKFHINQIVAGNYILEGRI